MSIVNAAPHGLSTVRSPSPVPVRITITDPPKATRNPTTCSGLNRSLSQTADITAAQIGVSVTNTATSVGDR